MTVGSVFGASPRVLAATLKLLKDVVFGGSLCCACHYHRVMTQLTGEFVDK